MIKLIVLSEEKFNFMFNIVAVNSERNLKIDFTSLKCEMRANFS